MTKPNPVRSAWVTALKLLGGRDYSRPEMAAKLAQRGFPEPEIEEALAKLVHYNYIAATGTDRERMVRMARDYLAKKKNPSSPGAFRSLDAFLLRKGFEPELVANYLAELTGLAEG